MSSEVSIRLPLWIRSTIAGARSHASVSTGGGAGTSAGVSAKPMGVVNRPHPVPSTSREGNRRPRVFTPPLSRTTEDTKKEPAPEGAGSHCYSLESASYCLDQLATATAELDGHRLVRPTDDRVATSV